MVSLTVDIECRVFLDAAAPLEREFHDWFRGLDEGEVSEVVRALLLHGYRGVEMVRANRECFVNVGDARSLSRIQAENVALVAKLTSTQYELTTLAHESDEVLKRELLREREDLQGEFQRELQRELMRERDALQRELMRERDALQREREERDRIAQLHEDAVRSRQAAEVASIETRLRGDLYALESRRAAEVAALEKALASTDSTVYREMYEALLRRIDDMTEGSAARAESAEVQDLRRQLDEMESLKRQLSEMESALNIARRSNFGLGAVGEHMVSSFLRSTNPACEVRDSSRDPHSCDLWFLPSPATAAHFVAFECKNKDAISTRGDVAKFYADIDRLTERHGSLFLGAVFVSCKSSCIPGKGTLTVEFVRDRPVLFVGFDCPDSGFPWLAETLKVFLGIAEHMRRCREDVSAGGEDKTLNVAKAVHDKLLPLLDRVSRVRTFVEKMRCTHLAAAIEVAAQADIELRALFGELADVRGLVMPPQEGNGDGEDDQPEIPNPEIQSGPEKYGCVRCGRSFESKRGLSVHAKRCERPTSRTASGQLPINKNLIP
jgi:hypothetical protein